MEILVWYDCPQVWVDTVDGQLRLFVNWEYVEEDHYAAISGRITQELLDRVKNDLVKLDKMWESLSDYRGHMYIKPDLTSLNYGDPIRKNHAHGLKPFGDAYLNK